MKVRLKTCMTRDAGKMWPVGSVLDTDKGDVTESTALRLVETNQASHVGSAPKPKAKARKPKPEPTPEPQE